MEVRVLQLTNRRAQIGPALLKRRQGSGVQPLCLKRIARLETEFLLALPTAVRRSSGAPLRSQ
jgi:hypothetical protein